jgi:thiamine monophosphate synthase
MHFNKFYFDFFYLFITNIDQQIFKNILKFKGIVIVYNQSCIADLAQFTGIRKFCRKNNIKFFILNNYKLALKYDLDGLVLSHNNKTHSHSKLMCKKNFTFVGKVHNQNDYYVKYYQNCSKIILSPIFKNDKYNYNKLLQINKFNLISRYWKKEIYALGGINLENLKKIKMTNSKGIGFSSAIFNPQIKKPVLY